MLVLSRVGYLLLLIAAAGTIVLALRSADAEKWVQHSLDVRSQARELYRNTQEAIIRERGFLLTVDPQYLGNFNEIASSLLPLARSLQSLVADNPDQVQRLAAIEPKLVALLDSLQNTIGLVQNGQKDAALGVVRSNHVLNLNSEIRKSLDTFIDSEQALLIGRQERAALLQNMLLPSSD